LDPVVSCPLNAPSLPTVSLTSHNDFSPLWAGDEAWLNEDDRLAFAFFAFFVLPRAG